MPSDEAEIPPTLWDTIEVELPPDLEVSIYGTTMTVRGTRAMRFEAMAAFAQAEADLMGKERRGIPTD